MIHDEATLLTLGQQAAVARLAYAVESPAAVAVLCGPPGVGKSLVLDHVAMACSIHQRPCHRCTWRDGMPEAVPSAAGGGGVELVDDAHEATPDELAKLVESRRRHDPASSIVLAGEGRLLTLIARDARIEQAVILRATLKPFSIAESTLAVATRLPPGGTQVERDAIVRVIHDLAAGIPARVVRLADLLQTVAAGTPSRRLTPADVEAVHRRLTLQAA